MIYHPGVLALLVSSQVGALMLFGASWIGKGILRKWDLASGSELQLQLERRTYLVSSLVALVLLFQVLSLFLFAGTADALHSLFTGAMCAAGTLAANGRGYPTLVLKLVTCLLSGIWLIINHADSRGYDYPLIRPKYLFLNLLAVLVLVEAALLTGFFWGLKGDMITACCGSLFSSRTSGFGGAVAGLPPAVMVPLFFVSMTAVFSAALFFLRTERGAVFLSVASIVAFLVALTAVFSFIGPYYYELPSHHCPFCILQREYRYEGYLLYPVLMGGAVCGSGVGVMQLFRNRPSLAGTILPLQRRLALVAIACYLLFLIPVLWRMAVSNLKLF